MKLYEYKNCSTCQKAVKFLKSENVKFESVPIVDQPPTKSELKKMLSFLQKEGGHFKNLFNTSGVRYRELKISEQMKNGMTEAQALELLSSNGKLIKRPFLLMEDRGAVGFDPEKWKKLLNAK